MLKAYKNSKPDITKCICIFLILIFGPILWLFTNSYQDFTSYSLPYLALGFILNSSLQVIFIFLIARLCGKKFLFFIPILIIALVAVNFRYNVLPLMATSLSVKIIFLISSMLLTAITLYTKSGLRFAVFFSLILIFQPLINQVKKTINLNTSNINQVPHLINAKYHRNIYLLGLDSIPDNDYFKTNFNTEPPWDIEFSRQGFRNVTGAHNGGGVGTRESYLNIMSLHSVPDTGKWGSFYRQSFLNQPLNIYQLVKDKGYKIQFMFHSPYLGSGNNKFMDYSYPTEAESIILCPFINPTLGFYLCNIRVTNVIEILLKGEIPTIKQIQDTKDRSISIMLPFLFDRIQKIGKDSAPWISITHLWEPGHTLDDYRHYDTNSKREFGKIFQQRAENATRDALNVINKIKSNDSNPIIIIYGDHGPYLSRGWETDSQVKSLFSKQEVIEDRQGIGFYVYPQNFCTDKIANGYLLSTVVADVFNCLDKENNL